MTRISQIVGTSALAAALLSGCSYGPHQQTRLTDKTEEVQNEQSGSTDLSAIMSQFTRGNGNLEKGRDWGLFDYVCDFTSESWRNGTGFEITAFKGHSYQGSDTLTIGGRIDKDNITEMYAIENKVNWMVKWLGGNLYIKIEPENKEGQVNWFMVEDVPMPQKYENLAREILQEKGVKLK